MAMHYSLWTKLPKSKYLSRMKLGIVVPTTTFSEPYVGILTPFSRYNIRSIGTLTWSTSIVLTSCYDT